MSGKRAKPSPWRFLRLAPVALVSMAVCAMVGLFLLLSGSGDDQAHDWGLDPVPSGSHDQQATGPESSPPDSREPSASDTTTPLEPTTQELDSSPEPDPSAGTPSPTARLRRASASVPASQPDHQPTTAPAPEPTTPATGPAGDNPGKKKGHRKEHSPHGHKP